MTGCTVCHGIAAATCPACHPARVSLADLYSGDRRGVAAELAETVTIPHPLHGVVYADGADRCTHAKRCTTPTGKPADR